MARTAQMLELILTEAAGLQLDRIERAAVVAAISTLSPALDQLTARDLTGLEPVTALRIEEP